MERLEPPEPLGLLEQMVLRELLEQMVLQERRVLQDPVEIQVVPQGLRVLPDRPGYPVLQVRRDPPAVQQVPPELADQ